jgi:arsenite-transporting ATPase
VLLKRLVFFGGKGGVGKSTLACATALRLSEREKTLLVSIDPAHSLSGILGVQVGPSLKRLKENFFAIELDASRLVEEYTDRVLSALTDILPRVRSGIREYVKYLKNSPTALETAVLDRIVDYCMEFPSVIVDSAPTGQMLRLFETAHMVGGWFEFLKKVAEERGKVEAFMGRRDGLSELIEDRRKRLDTLVKIFREKTVVFAVANEEPLSMQEARDIENRLKDMRVQLVLNRWKSMECDCIKIPEQERPYSIESLRRLPVEELVTYLFQ